MFELTRQEQVIVAGFVLIFMLGFGTMHWRNSVAAGASVPVAAER
jgi:DNA-binding transcriptional regulator YbjK